MPVRTYTGIDLINYVTSPGSPTGTIVPTVSFPSQGVASMGGSGNGSDNETSDGTVIISASVLVDSQITAGFEGEIDLDASPAIPDNALISKVTLGVIASVSINGGAAANFQPTSDTPWTAACQTGPGGVSVTGPLGYQIDASISAEDSGSNIIGVLVGNLPPLSVSDTGSDSSGLGDTVEVVFDPPITKAEFILLGHHLLAFSMGAAAGSQAASGSVASIALNGTSCSESGNLSYSVSISNFSYQITYSDLPFSITLDPPGGNVEPGQIITVTSPQAQNLNYAATQGDNVIPVNVKKEPDGTVKIEVPYPPDDDCTAALGDCPQCEDCFEDCNTDLDSDACQECMAACLECLETELESVEAAEACNESSREPPEVDIVIICSNPTLFNGSVPLGNFTINVANGSGIYRFITNKTNDTVYTAERDGTTLDIKIPNPFGKSGFFRS